MSDDRPTWRPPDQRPPGGPPQPDAPPTPNAPGQPAPPYQPPPQFHPAPPYQPPGPAGPGWSAPAGPPPGPPGAYWPGAEYQPPPKRSMTPWIVVGVIVVLAIVGLIALGIAFGSSLGTFSSRTPLEDVTVGQCFDGIRTTDFDDGGQFSPGMLFGVHVVDCGEDHEAELIGRFTWPADRGDTYPGDTTIESFALNACADGFDEYVGTPFESSVFEMTYVYPQRQSWSEGTRSVECIAHPPAGVEKEAGSVRDANR